MTAREVAAPQEAREATAPMLPGRPPVVPSAQQQLNMEQDWMESRLAGLLPIDFHEDVRICCAQALEAPPAFANVWSTCHGEDPNIPAIIGPDDRQCQALIMFCNPFDEAQLRSLRNVVVTVDLMGTEAPTLVWVTHSCGPNVGTPSTYVDVSQRNIGEVLEVGVDGFVTGDHQGFNLALEVRAKCHKSASMSTALSTIMNERRKQTLEFDYLTNCIECILWDYLRSRMARCIPPVDDEIASGENVTIDGRRMGRLVGRGAYGSVYELPTGDGVTEVIKAVSKGSVMDLRDLQCTKRMIDAMRLISREDFKHPNIVRLHEIYHSKTHLFFRMELGGQENLYRRLAHRRKSTSPRPLSYAKTFSLIKQTIEIVAHLHLGPKLCHRDIKPENLIVTEEDDAIMLKLCDFDLSLIQDGDAICCSRCGTLPFTAPEVLLRRQYSGYGADIWSLGIVIFEIVGGVRTLERVLELNTADLGATEVARRIRRGFENPDSAVSLFREHCWRDIQPILPKLEPIVEGLLRINASERFRAAQMHDAFITHFVDDTIQG